MSILGLLETTHPCLRTGFGSLVVLMGLVGAAIPLDCPAQPAAPASTATTISRWIPTGNLNTARTQHTATLLPNGKVLVAGGRDSVSAPLSSAELYDPANGTWTLTGHMKFPRSYHSATLLASGKVLVVGGGSAELYDPGTGTWTLAGSSHVHSTAATQLQNGKVLVTADIYTVDDTFKAAAELYDPAAGTWSVTGHFRTPRYWSTLTPLPDGSVLAARGTDSGDLQYALAVAETYDPATGMWSATPVPKVGSVFHTATLLPSGKVLVAGGNGGGIGGNIVFASSELFDPATRTWSPTGDLAAARYGHSATLLPTGEVLVAGGTDQEGGYPRLEYVNIDSAEIYHPSAGTWTRTAGLGSARSGHTATLLPNGRVLVAGGDIVGPSYSNNVLASAEIYEHGSSPVTIGPGFTGSWFNPAQNGHGLALEVLPGQPPRLLMSWFTFAPHGGASWIVGLGPIDGNRAVLQGFRSVGAGGRFPPNFDAANVRQEDWGTLTFTFRDCDHGRVEWVSNAPSYGSGGMDLTRLTLPAGLTCP